MHCWHVVPFSSGSMTLGGGCNSGSGVYECCHCGLQRVRRFHQQLARPDGHGPFATTVVTVFDPDPDTCPSTPTKEGA